MFLRAEKRRQALDRHRTGIKKKVCVDQRGRESGAMLTIRESSRDECHTAAMSMHDTVGGDGPGQLFTSLEAAAIIGCARVTLAERLRDGSVPGWRNDFGRWMLDAAGLAVAKSVIHPMPKRREDCLTCHQIGDLLYSWETATVLELTPVMGIHEGNVRKHLNDLAARGLAVRRLDGAWELTAPGIAWIKPQGDEPLLSPTDFANELDREVSTGT